MRPCRPARKPCLVALILALAGSATAAEVRVARVVTPWAVATGVRLVAEADGETTKLRLEADTLAATQPALQLEKLAWRCTVAPAVEAGGEWGCVGTLKARVGGESRSGRLALSRSAKETTLALGKSKGSATLFVPATEEPARLSMHTVPVDWIAPLLAAVAPALVASGGTLQAELVLDAGVAGEWQLEDLSLDSPDGSVATAALDAKGRVAFRDGDGGQSLELDTSLTDGEWLVAPLYSKLGGRDVTLALRGDRAPNAGWSFGRWQLRDAGALDAGGSASLAADGAFQSLEVATLELAFPLAWDRYIGSVLAPAGLTGLATEGKVSGHVGWRANERWHGAFDVAGLSLADASSRFALEGVAGKVVVRESDDSALEWRAASVYGVPLGEARASFDVDASGWRLREPVVIPTLGGTLRLDTLTHDERAGDAEPWRGSISAHGLKLGDLTAALGWPAFGGDLSLKIPSFAGTSERIAIDGAIEANVFDGRVRIDGLALERPFGVAPSLEAGIALEDLDLQLLTGAFSFGSIEGRLDGSIAGLRLVDFSPVAFDADLHTDASYKGKRRISQRAVANLSSVGGAGAALSSGVARLFDSFPYAAIGLSCRLENNVCTMGGLAADGDDSAGAGYVIVRGSGIPHLTVQGFQKRVDWPVLVARLEEATSGAASPVVK